MRTIHELLIVLRDKTPVKNNKITAGLCLSCLCRKNNDEITIDEFILLHCYIRANIPNSKFSTRQARWGWKPGNWTSRLRWLNKHIELTKPNTTEQ